MRTFTIARSLDGVLEAWRLLYGAYRQAGYIESNPSRLHVCRQAIGAHSLVVMGRSDGQLVSTMTAIVDGPLGLPLDHLYPEELNALHAEDRTFCELGLLCQINGSISDLWGLMRYAYYFAIHQGATDCVCGIPPERTRLYSRLFGFRPVGEVRERTKAVDNPVQLVQVSSEYVRAHFPQHRALNRVVQNPLPKSVFSNRFTFAPEALAGSPLELFLNGS